MPDPTVNVGDNIDADAIFLVDSTGGVIKAANPLPIGGTITEVTTVASVTDCANVQSVDLVDAVTDVVNVQSVDLVDAVTSVTTVTTLTSITNDVDVVLKNSSGTEIGTNASPAYTAQPNTKPRRAVDLLGIPVVGQRHALLSGMWTYGVPGHLWRTGNTGGGDGTVSSTDGALVLTSGTVDGGVTFIQSRAHPRYQPDRMFGLGTATPILPTGAATLRIGLFTTWEGFYIEIDLSDHSAAVYTRRTTGVVAPSPEDHTSGLGASSTTDTKAFDISMPAGADYATATLHDLWTLWRGVAGQLALVNLDEAGVVARLGSATTFTVSNPALPFRIELERGNPGANVSVSFGCVSVDSVGGNGEAYDYLPIESGDITLDQTERPLICVQAAGFLGGLPCTRDHIVSAIGSIQVDAASTVRVYRNATVSADGAGTWSIPDSTRGLALFVGSNTSTVTTTGANLLWSRAFAANEKYDLTPDIFPPVALRPIEGTATTGANRGDPAYGETVIVTVQKKVAGAVVASATPVVGSLY